jgi:putative membrane protein
MKNHARVTLASAVIAMLAMTACHRDADDAATDTAAAPAASTVAPAAPASDTATAAPAPAASQGALLGVVATIDKHEVAAAEQARSKKVGGAVLDYANMLHREHSANLKAGEALASGPAAVNAESSPDATALQEKGRAELATLDQKSGKDYETAYVDAMVKGHTEALATLDDKLLPAAQDENVRNFLTNTRDHVAMHLEQGKKLQSARK